MTALRQFMEELRRRGVIRVLVMYTIAGWVAMLGAIDPAYEVMNAALDEFSASGTIGVAWAFLWLRELAEFRADPRFAALAARMKMPEFWEKHGPPDGYDWRDGKLVAH